MVVESGREWVTNGGGYSVAKTSEATSIRASDKKSAKKAEKKPRVVLGVFLDPPDEKPNRRFLNDFRMELPSCNIC